jgi:hypothetical protein
MSFRGCVDSILAERTFQYQKAIRGLIASDKFMGAEVVLFIPRRRAQEFLSLVAATIISN